MSIGRHWWVPDFVARTVNTCMNRRTDIVAQRNNTKHFYRASGSSSCYSFDRIHCYDRIIHRNVHKCMFHTQFWGETKTPYSLFFFIASLLSSFSLLQPYTFAHIRGLRFGTCSIARECSLAMLRLCSADGVLPLLSLALFCRFFFLPFYYFVFSCSLPFIRVGFRCVCGDRCACAFVWVNVCLYGFSDQSFHTCFISGGEHYISAAGFACWRSFKACLPTSQHIHTILFSETFSFLDDLFSCVVSLTHRKRKKKSYFLYSFLVRKNLVCVSHWFFVANSPSE